MNDSSGRRLAEKCESLDIGEGEARRVNQVILLHFLSTSKIYEVSHVDKSF